MSIPNVVSRDEWLAARTALLAAEKDLTRARDAVAAQRRELPTVAVEKDYVLEGPSGKARLIDLFEGRPQLIVYHFMWRPDLDAGCPACSFVIDNVGHPGHLHACGTTLALVSRAPIADIEGFRTRMGWSLPWYSSFESDFNNDFHVTQDESVAPVEYNYMDRAALEQKGLTWNLSGEQPGISVFLRDGDRVLHSYSAYSRGLDALLGTYQYLDLTPLGRQRNVIEFPHHDQYGE